MDDGRILLRNILTNQIGNHKESNPHSEFVIIPYFGQYLTPSDACSRFVSFYPNAMHILQ